MTQRTGRSTPSPHSSRSSPRPLGSANTITIERTVVNDLPVAALLDASDGADLLVVGARGLGPVRRLLLGSVSQQCLHHATCPVAIVRDGVDQNDVRVARIVVGVDGSENARHALQWALEAGRLHKASVNVVHAWTSPRSSASLASASHSTRGPGRPTHERHSMERSKRSTPAAYMRRLSARWSAATPQLSCWKRPTTPTWWL